MESKETTSRIDRQKVPGSWDQQPMPWRMARGGIDERLDVGSDSVSRASQLIIRGFAWLARKHQDRREKDVQLTVGGVVSGPNMLQWDGYTNDAVRHGCH